MAKTMLNGHGVEWFGDEMGAWYYEDGEIVKFDGEKFKKDGKRAALNPRPCPKCGKLPDSDGHDACLGKLPGVQEACCGHGRKGEGYILFENGKLIGLGKDAKVTTLNTPKRHNRESYQKQGENR